GVLDFGPLPEAGVVLAARLKAQSAGLGEFALGSGIIVQLVSREPQFVAGPRRAGVASHEIDIVQLVAGARVVLLMASLQEEGEVLTPEVVANSAQCAQ